MTGASKILTVSYGTFSCTLEGFDDPFNTMKAIAEYFRDLAAGDRYFGAEPPVPDAAMLHRIAEREIHRRVEAKIQDNGVILRAADDDAPALAAEPEQPSLVASVAATDDTVTESVAARLQRIRAKHTAALGTEPPAATSVAVTAAAVTTATVAEETYIEDEHAEDAPFLRAETVDVVEQIEIPDQIEDILDEAENDLAMIDLGDQLTDNEQTAADVAADDLIADNLPEDDLVADDWAEAPIDESTAALTEEAALAEVEATEVEAEEVEAVDHAADDALLASLQSEPPEDGAASIGDTDLSAELPEDFDTTEAPDDLSFDGMFEDEDMPSATLAEAQDATAEVTEPAEDLLLSRLLGEDAAPVETPTAAPAVQDQTATPSLDEDDAILANLIDDADQPAPPQPAPRARARVIRIRRTDAPAAMAPVADEAQINAPIAAVNTALSDEAEAALQAELAALEAEISGTVDPAPLAEPDDYGVAAAAATASPSRLSVAAPAEDDAVNRLLAHANSEMSGEDTRRRQSAIAHLKAAVAATEADRLAGTTGGAKSEERQEAYRDDLDRAVRPRRPVSNSSTPRPSAEPEAANRATPLVLVSAQRIDRAPAASETAPPRVVMPVRPRRITGSAAVSAAVSSELMQAEAPEPVQHDVLAPQVMQDADQVELDEDDILAPGESDNVFAEATSFEEFADQLGATQLTDLLEAAAVYCAEVLQRPEFSRPLVMRQVASVSGLGETSREDYLRGFGGLLRQGRIAKVKRGMFTLTDRSPYLAEARKISG